jgi:hypothetical protein
MDVAIFLVRVFLSVLLYVFLGALFVLLWRDLKSTKTRVISVVVKERPAQLRVLEGDEALAQDCICALATSTTIGRAESNTIVVADPYASAEHAVVAWRSGQWWVEDRDSRNGTLVNGLPIEEPLIISQGDVIGVGRVRFQFEYADNKSAAMA